MLNMHYMNKALRLSWIPRLLGNTKERWKTIPVSFLRKHGGLGFLLKCNYDCKYINKDLPLFYRNMLAFFKELNKLYKPLIDVNNDNKFILFNNKNIRIGREPFFWNSWFEGGRNTLRTILRKHGKTMSFEYFMGTYLRQIF